MSQWRRRSKNTPAPARASLSRACGHAAGARSLAARPLPLPGGLISQYATQLPNIDPASVIDAAAEPQRSATMAQVLQGEKMKRKVIALAVVAGLLVGC